MFSDWNPYTIEDAYKGQQFLTYSVEKKFADLATIEFAEKHPEIDITLRRQLIHFRGSDSERCLHSGPFLDLWSFHPWI